MGRNRSEDPGTTTYPAAVLTDHTKLAPRVWPSFFPTRAYVPISTNGGTSLYLGNNPDANFRAIVAALRFGSGRRTGNHDGALRNGG
jgi:hypothetical protein